MGVIIRVKFEISSQCQKSIFPSLLFSLENSKKFQSSSFRILTKSSLFLNPREFKVSLFPRNFDIHGPCPKKQTTKSRDGLCPNFFLWHPSKRKKKERVQKPWCCSNETKNIISYHQVNCAQQFLDPDPPIKTTTKTLPRNCAFQSKDEKSPCNLEKSQKSCQNSFGKWKQEKTCAHHHQKNKT